MKRMLVFAALLTVCLAPLALAQPAEQPLTLTFTLAPDQVTALKAARAAQPVLPAMSMPIPVSTPDYEVVPKAKPAELPFKAWVESKVTAYLDGLVADVDMREKETLAQKVRGATPAQKAQIRALLEAK